ncbi:MAG TPA: hypothetical protein VFD03_01850 [Clostridia bacterium]|nr:hypothetical protein [Clostridia bacterium]
MRIIKGNKKLIAFLAIIIMSVCVLGNISVNALSTAPRATLAQQLLARNNLVFATRHASGVVDNANVYRNMVDTSQWKAARRSSYGTAPGGSVYLSQKMLASMLDMSYWFSFSVSEIAGGSHSAGSKHYTGASFDVNRINGVAVSSRNIYIWSFMNRAKQLGATYVAYEGNHVHVQW